jgi:pimeloyl-ACP methyl ester carboxylesterase
MQRPPGVYEPVRPPRYQRRRLRELEYHLTRWGPDSGAPIVFLHGFLDVGETFQFVVDRFRRDWPVLAPDWRGFGRSEATRRPYWFPDYLADLDALLDAETAAPVTLIGHSMGGNVAGLYAGIRPERVAALITMEGIGLSRTTPDGAPERYRSWLDELKTPQRFSEYASIEEFAGRYVRNNPRVPPERAAFVASRWTKPLPAGGIGITADPAHRLVNPVLYRREEAEACWARIEAPVLLIQGERSPFPARLGADARQDRLGRLFKRLEIATIGDAGHMMHHEQPEAVAQVIEAFLEHREAGHPG